jgi:hypothetical protein
VVFLLPHEGLRPRLVDGGAKGLHDLARAPVVPRGERHGLCLDLNERKRGRGTRTRADQGQARFGGVVLVALLWRLCGAVWVGVGCISVVRCVYGTNKLVHSGWGGVWEKGLASNSGWRRACCPLVDNSRTCRAQIVCWGSSKQTLWDTKSCFGRAHTGLKWPHTLRGSLNRRRRNQHDDGGLCSIDRCGVFYNQGGAKQVWVDRSINGLTGRISPSIHRSIDRSGLACFAPRLSIPNTHAHIIGLRPPLRSPSRVCVCPGPSHSTRKSQHTHTQTPSTQQPRHRE